VPALQTLSLPQSKVSTHSGAQPPLHMATRQRAASRGEVNMLVFNSTAQRMRSGITRIGSAVGPLRHHEHHPGQRVAQHVGIGPHRQRRATAHTPQEGRELHRRPPSSASLTSAG
jgi:hypothetical protein